MPIGIPKAPDLPANDIGNQAFSMLLGEDWWNIAARSSDIFGGPFVASLETLNWVLMFAVSGFTLYNLVVMSLGTAHEGRMGGAHNNVWYPIRIIAGMGMTMPIAVYKGLSVFQILILSLLGWSMTLANNISEEILTDLSRSNFSVMTAELPPHMKVESQNLAKVIYEASFAQYSMQKFIEDEYNRQRELGGAIPITPWRYSNPFAVDEYLDGEWVIKFAVPPNEGVRPDQLGTIRIPGKGPADPLMIQKREGIVQMYNIVQAIAFKQVNGIQNDAQAQVEPGWLKDAVRAYNNSIINYLQTRQDFDSELSREVAEFRATAKEYGWFSLGAYPMLISNFNRRATADLYEQVDMKFIDTEVLLNRFNDPYYRDLSTLMSVQMRAFNAEPSIIKPNKTIEEISNDSKGIWDFFFDSINGSYPLETIVDTLKNREDPIIVFSRFGDYIMNTGIAIWFAGLAAHAGLGAADALNNSFWGGVVSIVTGGASSSIAGGTVGVLNYISGYMQVWLTGLLIFGAILNYLLPAMPLIYWSLAMVGFIFLVVEVLVAAPFWAAAHAWSTKDEGFAGEMGRKGYVQFIEILFRPPLMVMGFYVILMIMKIMAWVVGTLIELYVASVFDAGLLFTFFMSILVGFMYMYMFHMLCSEGYSKLPRNIIRWIGGEGRSLGSARQTEDMKTMIAGGFSGVGAGSNPTPSGQGGKKKQEPKDKGGQEPEIPGEVSAADFQKGTGAKPPQGLSD